MNRRSFLSNLLAAALTPALRFLPAPGKVEFDPVKQPHTAWSCQYTIQHWIDRIIRDFEEAFWYEPPSLPLGEWTGIATTQADTAPPRATL